MTNTYVQAWPRPTLSLRERVHARVAADEIAGITYPPMSDSQAVRLTELLANQRAGQ